MTEQEARAEAEAWLKRLDGDSHWARSPEQRERIDHERTILSSLLLAVSGRNPKCEIGTKIAELSEWIDGSYPESLIGTELHVRRRVDKLMEESGEVGQAVGGWFGENPRKGVTHTRADVLAELLDVAVTALGAYESLTGNAGSSIPALDAKLSMILERAGLSAALGGGDNAE